MDLGESQQADTTRQTRAHITKEDQVHVTKGVCRGASSGAWRWFPVLVDRAEYTFEALPGVVVEHGRRRTHYFTSLRVDPSVGVCSGASAVSHMDTSSSIRHSILTRAFTRSFSIFAKSSFVFSSTSSLVGDTGCEWPRHKTNSASSREI